MGAHHYLPFRGLVGRSVRHVAVLGELWVALVGWHAGAFKLKARDRWIGWLPEQQFRRLHLIANNARFLILPGCAAANLASRVLGLSLRRLSGDFHALHGHPVLIAETFVDRSRFTGACYRAANWQVLGQTRGFARKPGTPATWVPHGRPKEVLVYPLARDAREQLCRLDDAPKWRSEGDPRPWTAHRLRSLWECLHGVPDFRSTRGRRYPLATIVTIAVAAKLAGYRGATAIGEFSQGLTQHQLRTLRAFYSPRLKRFTAPSTTAFVKVLTRLDPDVLDRAARTWAAQQSGVTAGAVRRELAAIAVPATRDGRNMVADDFAVNAGWGHFGKDDAVMPGPGQTEPRGYTSDERSVLGEALGALGENAVDVYVNAQAYWRNVPAAVWEYRLGGYQVLKKWLSYRERSVLGRALHPEEVQHFTDTARRIAAIVLEVSANDSGVIRSG